LSIGARPSLLAILRAAHHGRSDLTLSSFTDIQIRWAVTSGLGPLLVRSVARDPAAPASPHWPLLRGADALRACSRQCRSRPRPRLSTPAARAWW
jgi:hypothetical protein